MSSTFIPQQGRSSVPSLILPYSTLCHLIKYFLSVSCIELFLKIQMIHFSSVTQSCPTLCDPWTQHARPPCLSPIPGACSNSCYYHQVRNAIQPSHPLSSSSPPDFNLSQNQGLFQWVSSLHQVAKVVELQLQHQSFQWIFRTDFPWDWLIWYLAVQGTLKSLLQHHSSSAAGFLYGPTLTSIHDYWKNHSFD